ncbi:efflux RND transporter periplasmic adaptor subunit [Synechococcus sp. PCC 7336]|uniref:efflux RND transporter periplasmic adaptor subunit n=1 Tax=Synechococcus sp. PCC 7336 TaxID=195250 RepID=UPI00138AD479|nr:efflux RND transporter periplasmic adaptor subunit [Synechococcus sp. PCC 7336]
MTEPVESYNVTRAFTGEVVALHASELGFERNGKAIEIFVDDGDRLTRGAPLARLDTRNLETQRLAIKAQLLQVEAVIRDLEEQLKLSEVQLDRREGLLVEGAISREQRDEFSFGTDSLRARRDAQVASIQQLEAQLADIDVNLDKSILRAPFDGEIAQRYIDRGTVVEAGQPILRLVDASNLEVRIGIPAEMADRLEIGSSHTVLTDSHSSQAEVKAILPEIDLATRTRTVILGLDNPANVVPGEVVRLELQSDPIATSGFWLPLSALVQGERGLWSTYALTAADSGLPGLYRVERRDVEVLHTEGDLALVKGTLQVGETLVDRGVHRIVPGQLVRPLSSLATTQIETQS